MRPLILDYKLSRVDDGEPAVFEYDPITSLNMVNVDGINTPFIETKRSDIELETKTKVHQEQDDDERLNLLDMETKTLKTQERDDEHFGTYQ